MASQQWIAEAAQQGGFSFARTSDVDTAARKLIEIANGIESVQDGRIFIERINTTLSRGWRHGR